MLSSREVWQASIHDSTACHITFLFILLCLWLIYYFESSPLLVFVFQPGVPKSEKDESPAPEEDQSGQMKKKVAARGRKRGQKKGTRGKTKVD